MKGQLIAIFLIAILGLGLIGSLWINGSNNDRIKELQDKLDAQARANTACQKDSVKYFGSWHNCSNSFEQCIASLESAKDTIAYNNKRISYISSELWNCGDNLFAAKEELASCEKELNSTKETLERVMHHHSGSGSNTPTTPEVVTPTEPEVPDEPETPEPKPEPKKCGHKPHFGEREIFGFCEKSCR